MANIRIDVNNSKQILRELEDAIETILEETGLQAQNYATAICPHDTGRLEGSITHATAKMASTVTPPAKEGDGVTDAPDRCVVIGTNVEYAAYVEVGTHRVGTFGTNAQPYLKPAVTEHDDDYKKIAEDVLKNRQ